MRVSGTVARDCCEQRACWLIHRAAFCTDHAGELHDAHARAQQSTATRGAAEAAVHSASPADRPRAQARLDEARRAEEEAHHEHASHARTVHEGLVRREHEKRERLAHVERLRARGHATEEQGSEAREAVQRAEVERRKHEEVHGAPGTCHQSCVCAVRLQDPC